MRDVLFSHVADITLESPFLSCKIAKSFREGLGNYRCPKSLLKRFPQS